MRRGLLIAAAAALIAFTQTTTTTTLTVSANAIIGKPVTLTATVAPTTSGIVEFTDDRNPGPSTSNIKWLHALSRAESQPSG